MKKTLLPILLIAVMVFQAAFAVAVFAEETAEEIVAAAYALAQGKALEGQKTLTGVIESIDTAYNGGYNNITVTIKESTTGKAFQCFRMVGGADLGIGDTITVTGTIKNYNGTIEFDKNCTFVLVAKAEAEPEPEPEPELTTEEEIVNAAFALEVGKALSKEYTLTGVITDIPTPYNAEYKNVSVIIKNGATGKEILCYRLSGEGADELIEGDEIKVTGILKNYKGTVEFDQGCTYVLVAKAETEPEPEPEPELTTEEEIVNAAFALEVGKALSKEYTLTGVITSIKTPYDSEYKNVSVIIKNGATGKEILCYRMKGEGADDLFEGDEIKVTGILKNYNGTIEFDQGCTFVMVKAAERPSETEAPLTTPEEIITAAYALEEGKTLRNTKYSLTGKIKTIDEAYNAEHNNITLTIVVEGFEDMPLYCYRIKGDDADKLGEDDVITVNGYLTNYRGTIEFAANSTFVLVQAGPNHGKKESGDGDALSIILAAMGLASVCAAGIVFSNKRRSK